MPDQLSILNQALSLQGQRREQSLEGLSVTGAKVNGGYDDARKAVLERHGWLGALRYASIEPAAELSNWKYNGCYLLPGDCLRIWTLANADLTWELGTVVETVNNQPATRKCVWSNRAAERLDLAYVWNAPAEALSQTLADAIAAELAARTFADAGLDARAGSALRQEAERRFAVAFGQDGMQEGGQDVEVPDAPFLIRQRAL